MVGGDVSENHPPIPGFLRAYTIFELIVLVAAGIGAMAAQALLRPIWPWDIAPFNLAFIGAIYLASVIPIGMLAVGGKWKLARLILPMLLAFTGLALIATLINLGRFHFERPTTWAWFFLYITLPVNAAAHLWLYRGAAETGKVSLPDGWRNYLIAQSAVVGIYGLAQFIAPAAASGFWPWAIDAFHGQIYSGAFASLAIGGLLVVRGVSRAAITALAISQIGIAALAIGGLLLIDAGAHRVDWGAIGTWGWIGGFVVLGIAGLGMLWGNRAGSTSG